MNPLVTVITPSYNQGRFIRKTIESVLTQDYSNIEYIIVDGGSTDETLDILNEYKGLLKYISEKDEGQSDAINKGFRMAKGEIVAWLNSDDVYEKNCISKIVNYFIDNPNLGLLYGEGYIIDENDTKIKIFEATQEFDLWTLINVWDYIMQPTTFFRASKLKEINYLNTKLHYCMDWDLWIRLALVSEVKYINEILACSREYNETKTSTGGARRLHEIAMLMKKYSFHEEPIGIKLYQASTTYTEFAHLPTVEQRLGQYLVNIVKNTLSNLPIRYSDNWIGKELSLVLPYNVEKVRIILSNILAENVGQDITISLNGNIIFNETLNIVHHKIVDLDLTEIHGIKYLDISCTKVHRPSSEDDRLLSILVEEIHYLNLED